MEPSVADGARWHSAQNCTVSLALLRDLATIFARDGFPACALPGPWQRSQLTPGCISLRSGPGFTAVAWHEKQRSIVVASCATPSAWSGVAEASARWPNVRAACPAARYHEMRCSRNRPSCRPTNVIACAPAPNAHSKTASSRASPCVMVTFNPPALGA